MPRALVVESLSVRGFRNLAALDLALGPRFNVLFGDNGQGKTNVLEAAYAVLTSKSFRASKPGELVVHGGDIASVRASITEGGERREQSLGLRNGGRLARIDGKKPKTLAEYAYASPVVVFHPGVVALSMGGGSERRRLLDRVALYTSPQTLVHVESYERAVRERQRALEARGVSARDLEPWEDLAVTHGLAVMEARRGAAGRMRAAGERAFGRLAPIGATLEIVYQPGAPEDGDAFRARLVERRPADLRRGSATIGPHRDELALSMNGRPMRGVASQGQHRGVVLALKLAEIEVIGETRGVRPVLLLDDVSSELDRARTEALFAFLGEHQGQVLLTTTRPEMMEIGALTDTGDRRDFSVERGAVTAA